MVYFSQSCEEQPECLPCTETFKKGKGFFIMKKLTALLLSLCMVLTMACATALAEGKTASATAEGFGGGNVTVTLSVDGDKLAQDVRNRLTAIEHAAESETNARTAADTDLQSDMNTVKTTLTVKTACHFGTYTGDGTEKRTITLGYHPKAVLVFREGCYTGYSSAIYGGLASEDVPLMYGDSVGLGVTADGFQLLNSRNCALNLSGYKYSFAVFA